MINKDDEEFYEKYGLSNGSNWIRKNGEPEYFIQVTHNLNDDTRWVVVMDKDNFNVIHEIQLYGLVNKESVREFKIKGNSNGGWEETTQHKVWILTK